MDKPIMMSSEMVRAYQAGRKTQTRRTAGLEVVNQNPDNWKLVYEELGTFYFEPKDKHCIAAMCKSRFQVGDRAWVKEAIQLYNSGVPIRYQADCAPVMVNGESADLSMWKWKHKTLPGMFMPRQFSRFTLPITNVSCQRLQEISPEDCEAEGISSEIDADDWDFATQIICEMQLQKSYKKRWDFLNGKKYPWSMNPWVWVYYTSEVKTNVR